MAIRSSGYGSASARDVLISMAAFDEFDFDRDSEVLTLGAGLLWRNYYEKMEQVAPEYHGECVRMSQATRALAFTSNVEKKNSVGVLTS